MPRKELPSRTIYVSRPMPLTKGAPLLCDMSEARFDHPNNVDLVMPDVYRAPGVVLGMPWSYPIDLWGFAMTVRSILHLEFPKDPRSNRTMCQLTLKTAVGPFRAEAPILSTWRRWSLLRATPRGANDIHHGPSSAGFHTALRAVQAVLG